MKNEPLEKFKQEFLDLAFNEKFQYLREMEPVLGKVFRGLINNIDESLVFFYVGVFVLPSEFNFTYFAGSR